MTKLAEELKKVIEKSPKNRGAMSHTINTDQIIDAINEAGYKLECYQSGIQGTFLYLVKKTV